LTLADKYRSKHLRLLAIDPSLTCSGWALFSLADGQPLAAGVISPPGSDIVLSLRLAELQNRVTDLFAHYSLGSSDVLVCEGPAPLVLNPSSALKVEQVRGIFEGVARMHKLCVPGRVNPRTVQTELLGLRGRQLSRKEVKDSARVLVEKMFAQFLDAFGYNDKGKTKGKSTVLSQDIVDALLIGALAVGKVQIGMRSNMPLEEAFELSRSSWRQDGRKAASGWNKAALRSNSKVVRRS